MFPDLKKIWHLNSNIEMSVLVAFLECFVFSNTIKLQSISWEDICSKHDKRQSYLPEECSVQAREE